MTIRLPLTLPPYTPTSWELRLPGYPVITGSWRSAAYPEILGSMPSGAEWRLTFENKTAVEALALLLPWRATGGGRWPLTELPGEIAYGVDSEDFRKRLTGTTWTIAEEPQKQSIKNGRFSVTLVLAYELTLESRYGPRNPKVSVSENPLYLGLSGTLVAVAVPSSFVPFIARENVGSTAELETPANLSAVDFLAQLDQLRIISISGAQVSQLGTPGELSIAAANPTRL